MGQKHPVTAQNTEPTLSAVDNLTKRPMYYITLIGEEGVGKKTVLKWMDLGKYTEKYQDYDSIRRQLTLNDDSIIVDIHQVPPKGNDSILDLLIAKSDGFALAYSHSMPSSADYIPDIIEKIKKIKRTDKIPPVVLLNLKADLDPNPQPQKVPEDYKQFEISAKTSTNVNAPFEYLGAMVRQVNPTRDVIEKRKAA